MSQNVIWKPTILFNSAKWIFKIFNGVFYLLVGFYYMDYMIQFFLVFSVIDYAERSDWKLFERKPSQFSTIQFVVGKLISWWKRQYSTMATFGYLNLKTTECQLYYSIVPSGYSKFLTECFTYLLDFTIWTIWYNFF